jgi:hypothetical protein
MRLVLLPDPWPSGAVCRRWGCALAAVHPHGFCLACEVVHAGEMRARAGRRARAAAVAARSIRPLYAGLAFAERRELLIHIGAHVEDRGQLNLDVLCAAVSDFLAQHAERHVRP